MSLPKRNLIANLAGTAWTAILTLALVPVYLRLLGVEAYGLIGFFATLQSVLWILDLGLSTSLNREIAFLSGREENGREMRDLVKTIASLYWVLATILVLGVLVAAPYIAQYWVHPKNLSVESVTAAIRIMGLVIGLQFPFAIYSGGLMGLQRQVVLNTVIILTVTVRALATVGLLIWVSATVEVFFIAQLAGWVLQTLAARWALLHFLPGPYFRPSFRGAAIERISSFALGMTLISILAAILTQIDKVVLSQTLDLPAFGYYTIASTLAAGLTALANPFFTAVFPRFTQLLASGDDASLRNLYHQSSQLLSALILPTATFMAFFSREILSLWTSNEQVASRSSVLLSFLAVGFAANALVHIPYALQLAHKWTSLSVYLNSSALLVVIPTIFWASRKYGALGTAAVWIALNLTYLLVGVGLMHRRLLRGEKARWYLQDIGIPLSVSLIVAIAARMLLTRTQSAGLISMGVVVGIMFMMVGAATPATRQFATAFVRRRWTLHQNGSSDVPRV